MQEPSSPPHTSSLGAPPLVGLYSNAEPYLSRRSCMQRVIDAHEHRVREECEHRNRQQRKGESDNEHHTLNRAEMCCFTSGCCESVRWRMAYLLCVAEKLLLWLPLRGRRTAVDRLVWPRRGHFPTEFKKVSISIVVVIVSGGALDVGGCHSGDSMSIRVRLFGRAQNANDAVAASSSSP